MCLVVGKPVGAPIPGRKKLKHYFNCHPDGFGVSFQYRGAVRTVKGAMTIKEMFKLLNTVKFLIQPKRPEDIDMLLQWRSAVTGSVSRKFCHPFPVTAEQEQLDSLDTLSELALAHNGVIWDYNKLSYFGGVTTYKGREDINDAQEFIKDFVVGLGQAVFNPSVQKLIEAYTKSKFALLSSEGLYYIGDFIEENGCFYSNMYHKLDFGIEGLEEYTGYLCPLCFTMTPSLFRLSPYDDSEAVCANCYRQFTGFEPSTSLQIGSLGV